MITVVTDKGSKMIPPERRQDGEDFRPVPEGTAAARGVRAAALCGADRHAAVQPERAGARPPPPAGRAGEAAGDGGGPAPAARVGGVGRLLRPGQPAGGP